MPAHTHDGIDWVARLADLRQADLANGPALRSVADRLVSALPAPRPTVLDVGCGAGGMSAALAAALADRWTDARTRPGGTLVLVDMVPELLAAATENATAAIRPGIDRAGVDRAGVDRAGAGAVPGTGGGVDVRAVRADIADPDRFAELPRADLVWASNVVHHAPDQRAVVSTLADRLAPGGCLALSEGGLAMRCLPWDVGVGEPGLQDRLIAAHGTWFHRMRTEMPGSVRMPIGWNQALTDAGLNGVTAFSYLVDVPAPLSDNGRTAVVSWLAWMTRTTTDLVTVADAAALARLLDPTDQAYVGRRDDVFMLKASTVYLGWR
jgi:SAM-dependent methyltransferase